MNSKQFVVEVIPGGKEDPAPSGAGGDVRLTTLIPAELVRDPLMKVIDEIAAHPRLKFADEKEA